MEEQDKTNAQLAQELRAAQERINELEAGDALLHDVLENAQTGIFTVNDAYRFTYVNKQFCEITGYTEDELIGHDFRFLLDEETKKLTLERYERRQRGEVLPSRYVMHVIHKNGDCRTLQMSAAAGQDAMGQVRTLGQVVDITQRLQAEAALRRSEERYRLMADNIQDGLTIVQGRQVVYLNDRVCEIFGYPREELKHLSGLDIAAPEEKARIQALMERQRARGEPLESLMFWVLRPDGTRRYVHNRYSTSYDDEGTLLRFVVTTDMTERKRAEEEREALMRQLHSEQQMARAVMDNLPESIFWKDKDLVYLGCNTSFVEDAGLESPEQIIGQTDFDMPWQDRADLYRKDDRQVLDSGQPKLNYEEPQTTPDGGTIWLRTSKVPLYDAEGEVYAILGVYADITAEKVTLAEHERLQQEVIDAQREALSELSTPVIPVMERILVLPLIGTIDSHRARDIMRTLLEGISAHRAKAIILDVTGVPVMDTGVVNHINKTIQAARLKGAQTIVTGISDAVAESIVDLGIDWGAVETLRDLQTGLRVALQRVGIELNQQHS